MAQHCFVDGAPIYQTFQGEVYMTQQFALDAWAMTEPLVCFQDLATEAPGTYNYTDAAAMWGFAFSTTIMLWLVAHNLGQILAAIRRF